MNATKIEPMTKIFGIGLGKTGTTSLTDALKILGYAVYHWPCKPKYIRRLLDGDFRLHDLEEYDVILDCWPLIHWQQLDRWYPDAKWILTIREEESWLESNRFHMDRSPMTPERAKFAKEYYRIALYGTYVFNRDQWRDRYRLHNKAIREHFGERLLEMNIVAGDGWPELCEYLGHEIPVDQPFPYSNKAPQPQK